ncbi:hypothetical protein LC1Nh_1122 [Candidatus Nanohalobium constans]|uniref:Uncharacterized protein n=1 Tax=Candidatus Nanohalobium constans TaxID=2565781 RepID=A0A5Q0UIN6_9ARCH|nr:hypothetical protein LC1Nh_1122 [Candidatus Nanohalobium constans]
MSTVHRKVKSHIKPVRSSAGRTPYRWIGKMYWNVLKAPSMIPSEITQIITSTKIRIILKIVRTAYKLTVVPLADAKALQKRKFNLEKPIGKFMLKSEKIVGQN